MRIVVMFICTFLMCCGWIKAFQVSGKNTELVSEFLLNPTPKRENAKGTENKKQQDFKVTEKIELLDKRKSTIAKLIEMANDGSREINNLTFYKPIDSLPNIVETLGSYRAIESIPLLIKIKGRVALEQVNSFGQRESVPVFNYFYAAKALADIGNPAVEALLQEFTNNSEYSILNIQLNALILRQVYGKQVALYLLSELNPNTSSVQSANKLNIARETIQNYDSQFWGFNGQILGFRQSSIELRKKLGY